MYVGRGKTSPNRRTAVPWRPGSAKRVKGRTVSSVALTKATKTLSSVAVDTLTQRGNIKVVVRVRPSNSRESTANSRVVVHSIDSHMVVFDPPDEEGNEFYFRGVKQNYHQKTRHKNVKLAFDNVYGPQSTNPQIFEEVIKPMLDTLLNGFNCSVFAYGATGSGKTHTMLGNEDNPGLTFLTVMELYERLEQMETDYETEVAVSYLEVYNETVKDLLHSSGDLHLREDHNGVAVPNLTSHKPKDAAELLNLLAFGNSVRSQHPTDHNAESSRSHAVFQVYINLRSRCTELTNKFRSAKLVMVDLAGSERGAATGFHGQRFREGASINKSLLALGNCINALADGKKHIPYRDSKLSRILKDSLGGNCKTVMIANVSPSNLSYEDSYNTLRYADRAKRIKCQVKKNTMSVTACLTQYTKIVEEMSQKIEQLQQELKETQKNCRCKNQKIDASTEPDASEMGFNWSSNLPNGLLETYSEMFQRKQEALRILGSASATAATMAIKIRVKERRIASIKKFSTSGISQDKNTRKIKNQLEPLLSRHKEALVKKSKALQVLYHLEKKWEELEIQRNFNVNSSSIPVKLCDYLDLQNIKVEHQKLDFLKNFYKQSCRFFVDEWQKSETIVSKSVEFLNAQYLLTKHYGHNTRQMDNDYEALAGNLCGTHVRFPDEMDTNELESSVQSLSTVLEEESLMEEDGFIDENTELHVTKKDERIRFRRPPTPPRKNLKMSDSNELDVDNQESSQFLASFASETSVLNSIADCENLVTMTIQPTLSASLDNLNASNLSVPHISSSKIVFKLDETITLDELNSTSIPSPKNEPVVSNPDNSFPASFIVDTAQADGSIELNRNESDFSESFGPVPCFISDRSFMKQLLTDEPSVSPVKENVDPFPLQVDEDVDVFQVINSTFNLDQNATFDIGRSCGPQVPVCSSMCTPASILSNNLSEDAGGVSKFSGFQNRIPSKRIPTTAFKSAKGRSPIANTPSNLPLKHNRMTNPTIPHRSTASQIRPACSVPSSVPDHRFNNPSNLPWR